MNRKSIALIVGLLPAVLGVACASTDATKTASRRPTHASATIEREGIPYRTLVARDFQAPSLPKHLARRKAHTAAYLCGAIAGPSNLDVEITQFRGRLTARVLEPAYRAYVNPRCSWLDGELDRNARRYALAHEQVHFTLLEIEARQLNRAILELEIDLTRPEEAAPRAQQEVDLLRERARVQYLDRSERFDAEASHPSKQAELDRWRANTLGELEALQD